MPAPLIAGLIRGLIGGSARGAAVQTGGRAAATQAVRSKAVQSPAATAVTATKRTAPPVQPAAAAKRPDITNIFNSLSQQPGSPVPGKAQPIPSTPSVNKVVESVSQQKQSPESQRKPSQAAKPDISTMFRSAPSKGKYPPPPEWFVRPKPAQSVVPPKIPQQPGAHPAPGGKPAQGLFQKLTDAVSQSQSKIAELFKGSTSKPDDTATVTSPSMSGGGKPPIDFGRMMGMMNQTNAKALLEQEASRKQQETELSEQKTRQAAKEAEEQAKSLTGQLKSLGKSTLSGAKSILSLVGSVTGLNDAGKALGSLFSGDLVGAVKSGTKSMLKFATIMLALPFVIKRWTDSLVESRREMVMFNSRIAASIAQLDIQKFQHGRRRAGATEESTLRLNKAIGEFREEFQPISEDVRTIVNTLALIIVRVGTGTTWLLKIAAAIIPAAGLVKLILEQLEKDEKVEVNAALLDVLDVLKKQGNPQPAQAPAPPMGPLQ